MAVMYKLNRGVTRHMQFNYLIKSANLQIQLNATSLTPNITWASPMYQHLRSTLMCSLTPTAIECLLSRPSHPVLSVPN
jgi:hypothetical protein